MKDDTEEPISPIHWESETKINAIAFCDFSINPQGDKPRPRMHRIDLPMTAPNPGEFYSTAETAILAAF